MKNSVDWISKKEPFQPWEYLVNDFLELGCYLGDRRKRHYLLENLRRYKPSAQAIREHPCFSIGKKLIVICSEYHPKEYWVYFPQKIKILKWRPTMNSAPHKK